MKLKYIPFIYLLFFLSFNILTAQDLVFASKVSGNELSVRKVSESLIMEYSVTTQSDRLKEITPDLAGSCFFGDEVAKQEYLFESTYTYKVPVSPGNPALKTIVQKPILYSSVRKIEKQIRKDLRGKKIDIKTATVKYSRVLEIAICIFNQDTEKLEQRIKDTSNNNQLLELFTEEIRLKYIN
jgi:hypothetical protein